MASLLLLISALSSLEQNGQHHARQVQCHAVAAQDHTKNTVLCLVVMGEMHTVKGHP
jgi:hypothetical protein